MLEPTTVQTQEPASPSVKPVSPPTEPAKPVAPQPLTEERIRQLIVGAVEQGKQLGRKELQSAQDKNRAELARLSRQAQSRQQVSQRVIQELEATDPEAAQRLRLADYEAREQEQAQMEQEESMMRAQQEFLDSFYQAQSQFVMDLGIDPKDNRIDWGMDAPNPLEALKRIQASATKIQKESSKTAQGTLEKRVRDLEALIKQANIEVNSVEATTTGVVAGSDADFIKKFADGTLPLTKANRDRYDKIVAAY